MLPGSTIRNMERVVRRIYILILGLEGLKCKELNSCHPTLIGQSQATFTAKRMPFFCSFADQNWYFVGNLNYWSPCYIFPQFFVVSLFEFVCMFHVNNGALAPLNSHCHWLVCILCWQINFKKWFNPYKKFW